MTAIWAATALTAEGWRDRVRVTMGEGGAIASVACDAAAEPGDARAAVLLPAPANLHSHAFQRAMAGLTERRGAGERDSFWTWRQLMYQFLGALTPDHVEAIAALVQMETLEAGFASIGEFHYLHHQPGGASYDDPAEMAARIAAAAAETGVGLTLLPVFYERGGCDGRALAGGQQRFGCDLARYEALFQASQGALAALPADARLGVAPHSLRAAAPDSLGRLAEIAPEAPLHIHIAEQQAEIAEVSAAYGARPVDWLMASAEVGPRWCLIHATHMTPAETAAVAASGAVVGLCPITEASLGDGVFDGAGYLAGGGAFGVGSDSNIRIDLAEELRMLEYGQRLRDQARAVLATPDQSCGRVLFDQAALSGAQAVGRSAGAIAPGRLADLVALKGDAPDLAGRSGDAILDSFVFCGDGRLVDQVWSAGRAVVTGGRHIRREAVLARYAAAIADLRGRL